MMSSEIHNRIQREIIRKPKIYFYQWGAGGTHTVGTLKKEEVAAKTEKKERLEKVVRGLDYYTVYYNIN